MSDALNQRVSKLRTALETIEREVAIGAASRDTLEEFKLAIDHIRISVWALLTEQHTGGHETVVARYRIKSVIEICRHLLQDIDTGIFPASEPDLVEFRNVLEDTASRVTQLMQSGD